MTIRPWGLSITIASLVETGGSGLGDPGAGTAQRD